MAGKNANDYLIDDFCVTKRLSRVSKQLALASPLGAGEAAQATMLAAMG